MIYELWWIGMALHKDDLFPSDSSVVQDLLFALKNLLAVHSREGGTAYPAPEIARVAIAKAEGRTYIPVRVRYYPDAPTSTSTDEGTP